MKQLSIIVPIYNVEKYVRACIESIFRQGLDEEVFEVIIVNDGTEDNSMEMIEYIIATHSNIVVINQDNQGLSCARNKGIDAATGEYILMPDSDDMLVDNSLGIILNKAIDTKADLVVADFLETTDQEQSEYKDIQQKTDAVEKTGKEMLIEDLNPFQCYVWRTLFRRDFIVKNHLRFIPGICYEDVPFTHECYLKAHKCIRSSVLLNIYRKERQGSATFSFSKKKAKDICIVIGETWKLRTIEGLKKPELHKLEDDVFTSFKLAMWWISHYIAKSSDRTEIMDFLKEKAPDLHFTHGLKQRVHSFIYNAMPRTYIHIRYYLNSIRLFYV